MKLKTCTKCRLELPENQFQFTLSNGKRIQRARCGKCMADYHREYCKKRAEIDSDFKKKRIEQAVEWSKKNKEKRSRIAIARNKRELALFPEKVRARALVNQRVRFGRMPHASSLQCEKCGNSAHHYHHHKGYVKPHVYDVVPLCRTCHKAEDAALALK